MASERGTVTSIEPKEDKCLRINTNDVYLINYLSSLSFLGKPWILLPFIACQFSISSKSNNMRIENIKQRLNNGSLYDMLKEPYLKHKKC